MITRRLLFALVIAAALPLIDGPVARSAQAAVASVDWPSYNNDLLSDRFANVSLINTANVRKLHIVCTADLGKQGSFENGPIVVNGVLYATTGNATIALDAATCKQRWINTYTKPAGLNRGEAFAGGLVFRGFGDGHVRAINAATGATVWTQPVIAAGGYEFIDAAPVVWHSLVIIGTANGEGGAVCHVLALDQRTGRIVWSQQTVPNLGTSTAKTWAGAARIAGGATWTSYTVDPATGVLYVPVSNPAPDYDTRKRGGANLYTNSVLAFDAATGAFKAAIVLVPNDAHDWDQAATPAVVTLASGSKIALVAGKDGYLRAVDAKTLVQKWKTPITTIANATAPITTAGTHFCPSGAVLWNGAAYSPQTGLAYVNAVDSCRTVYRTATPAPFVPGREWLGSSNVVSDAAHSGWLTAADAATGSVRWRYHASLPLIAGVTPTAGGVLFTADLLGNVLAFDAARGSLLAKVATGMPVGGGVISYAVAGTQYVAVAAGITSGGWGTKSPASAIVVLGI